MVYRSPWIVQLKRSRPIQKAHSLLHPDCVVVGGGIAGVVTAYFILRQTSHTILLLEADRVAHGATGHNAGQVVSYFERPLHDIASQFGAPLTLDAYHHLQETWGVLDDIITTAHLRTPVTTFTGYAGYSTYHQLLNQLKTLHLLRDSKTTPENLLLLKESDLHGKIPSLYHPYISLIKHQELLQLLGTGNSQYIAAFPEKKGCTNSSLLTEELVGYLLSTYPERFHLSELTPVKRILVTPTQITLSTPDQIIKTPSLILCTNGYTTYQIDAEPLKPVLQRFHITSTVGYMNGYLDTTLKPPTATQYFTTQNISPIDPYYYLTRRIYEHGRHAHTLLCIGGPEHHLPQDQPYSPHAQYLPNAHHEIDAFIHTTSSYPLIKTTPDFKWHGLMGYTPTMIRLIGPDPHYPNLSYNLGCNGVGILPSIYAGKRLGNYLAGRSLKPSIFDTKFMNNKEF
ncbi:MAG: FAD-binding oxidoreductase [Candidatus Thermoplasmatota archaeon]|jgi:glycine/D-amino acid oxidase-like deaminating enzyme|nr:FAD-binding oxidoreductase [Candidatus Thermoplasmatota archaeon]